jgi:hypothetical protein
LNSKIPIVLAGIYATLVVLSVVPILIGNDALNGIFAVVLALPWTKLMSSVADAINPSLANALIAGVVMVLIGGAINTAIIYFVSRWIVRRVKRAKSTLTRERLHGRR